MTGTSIRIVLAGGGTGGHIIPALAVADELRNLGVGVRFIGTRGRIEERLVPAAGYELDYIGVRPISGGGLSRKVTGVASVPLSVLRASGLLRRMRPHVVMGVGGYVAGPVVLAARMMGIPTAFLEQNATLGMTNRLLRRFVSRAFVSYESTRQELPRGRAIVTGNPVKRAILEASAAKQADGDSRDPNAPVHILVMGGSQGARSIDERVPEAMAAGALGGRVRVLHQGHQAHMEQIRRMYTNAGLDCEVVTFIDDMAAVYRQADLVVSRSGATTVAEVTVMGLPAVFLPYPHHADRQQQKNAEPMRLAGAAVVLDETTLTIEQLSRAIAGFVVHPERRREAAVASAGLGHPDAAFRIATALLEMSG